MAKVSFIVLALVLVSSTLQSGTKVYETVECSSQEIGGVLKGKKFKVEEDGWAYYHNCNQYKVDLRNGMTVKYGPMYKCEPIAHYADLFLNDIILHNLEKIRKAHHAIEVSQKLSLETGDKQITVVRQA